MFWRQLYSITIIIFFSMILVTGSLLIESNMERSLAELIDVQIEKENSIVSRLELDGGSDYTFQTSLPKNYFFEKLVEISQDEGEVVNVYDGEELFYDSRIWEEDNFPIVNGDSLTLKAPKGFTLYIEKPDYGYFSHKVIFEDGLPTLQVGSIVFFGQHQFYRVKNIPIKQIFDYRTEAYVQLLISGIVLLLITSIIYYWISKRIMKPLEVIVDHITDIGMGENVSPLKVEEHQGYADLTNAVNTMQRDVEAAKYEMLRENERQSLFIRNMNHEIRTPLTSIIGYTELMLDERSTDKHKRDSAKFIQQEGKRLVKLSKKLSEILSVSEQEVVIEEISVESIFEHIELIYLKNDRVDDLRLISDVEIITSNFDLLIMLLINTIDNAFKASKLGDRVVVSIFKKDRCKLSIRDYGIGFDEQILENVYDPFVKTDYGNQKEQGSGLGLSICQQITEHLNGTIDIVNHEIGSEIIVTFPDEEVNDVIK